MVNNQFIDDNVSMHIGYYRVVGMPDFFLLRTCTEIMKQTTVRRVIVLKAGINDSSGPLVT